HDAVRQFLPAFGCLAIMAGLGAAVAVERFGRWGKGVVVASLVEGAASVALMMPAPLSYFSPIVGGLPGATRLGMEPTFYWDSLTDEALGWLNDHTQPERSIQFCDFPYSLFHLRRTGRLQTLILLPEGRSGARPASESSSPILGVPHDEAQSVQWYVL